MEEGIWKSHEHDPMGEKERWCERGDLNPYGFLHWILSAKNVFFQALDIGSVFP